MNDRLPYVGVKTILAVSRVEALLHCKEVEELPLMMITADPSSTSYFRFREQKKTTATLSFLHTNYLASSKRIEPQTS